MPASTISPFSASGYVLYVLNPTAIDST